jgi:hypothetical protein
MFRPTTFTNLTTIVCIEPCRRLFINPVRSKKITELLA